MDVLVRRKTTDLVRDAAESALRATCPALERLERAELWTFTVEGEDGAAVRKVLEDTTLVANPNVHRWALREAGVAPPPAPGRARIVVEVHDRVDAKGAAVLRALRERLRVRTVTGVRRGVLWVLDLAARRDEAEALAGEIIGRGAAGAGLLANPHAQEARAQVVTS